MKQHQEKKSFQAPSLFDTLRSFFKLFFLLLNFSFPLVNFIYSSSVSAAPKASLSEREVLKRCYNQLTGKNLSAFDPLWKRLSQERASAICLKLLDEVQLNSQGILVQPENPLNRAILKQLIDIHHSWFDQKWSYLNSFPETHWGGVDIYDPKEPALFLTRNLLTQEPYSQVLSGSQTAVVLRDGSELQKKLPPEANGFLRISRITNHSKEGNHLNSNSITYSKALNFNESDIQVLETPLLQMGEPIGIHLTSYQDAPLLPVIWTNILSPTATFQTPGLSTPQAFLANKGGGALGSIPYILLNFGHGFDYVSDGAAKLPRRYILSVFKNFLCRQGPFVRTSDVSPWKSNLSAAPAFRKAESCLRCHTTLDQAAIMLRNIRLGGVANLPMNNFVDYRTPPILATYDVDPSMPPQEFWPTTSDPQFFRTKPEGKLFFRSINGQLINLEANNLEALGKAITQTPDYYACAAQKYFEFFTHNKVELFDPYDSSNNALMSTLTPNDQEMRDFVLAIGKELQAKGSLKKLLKRILESDYYRQGNFGR